MTPLTLPELAAVAGTRAALGAGLELLLADHLPEGQRKAVGWTLVMIGVAATVPLAFEELGKSRVSAPSAGSGFAPRAPSPTAAVEAR